MPGDDAQEYTFTSTWLAWVGGVAAGLGIWIGLHVHGRLTQTPPFDSWAYLPWGLLLGVVLLWVVARGLVRAASFDGHRLHARTLLAAHEIDVADITALDWQVAESRVSSLNPLNGVTARIRSRGRTLRVPLPAGARLVRDLEDARSGGDHVPAPGRAPGDGQGREFDFTSWAETGWALQSTVIQYAALDDRCLRAVTVDGQDHTVRLADIEEVDHQLRSAGGEVLVRHRGDPRLRRRPGPPAVRPRPRHPPPLTRWSPRSPATGARTGAEGTCLDGTGEPAERG